MKHIIALLIKFVMVTVILSIVLGIMTSLTFGNILYLSVAVTVLSYVIGDLLILSASNNMIATIADFVIAFLAVYLFNDLVNVNMISLWDAIISAALVGTGEWFFHRYLGKKVLD